MMTVNFIGKSKKILKVKSDLEKIARSPYPVFLSGETGVGKEIAARYLHSVSDLSSGPFVVVPCGAIPSGLLANELFGHEKGAFTDACSTNEGKIELADNGYVFLDEFKSMRDSSAYSIFLTFMGNNHFRKLGGSTEYSSNARIIAADSSEDELPQEIYERFPFHVSIPPLRERREDVLLLLDHFSRKVSSELGVDVLEFSDNEKRMLYSYSWPGNVRELENTVKRRYVSGELVFDERIFNLKSHISNSDSSESGLEDILYKKAIEMGFFPFLNYIQKIIISSSLNSNDNVGYMAARELGIGRHALYQKIRRLRVRDPN